MDHPGFRIVILGYVLAAGCGSSSSPSPAASKPPEKKDEVVQRIGSRGVNVIARDEKRAPLWRAKAEEAEVDLTESGSVRASMKTVTGSIYDKGTESADFSGARGSADQARQELFLRQNVTLIGRKSGAKLTAETLDWLPTVKLIELKGAVTYQGDGLKAGPLPSIWVTRDLKQVGTPDSFKNDESMKKLVAPLLAMAALASAGTFADDKGNMTLSFKTWRATQVDAKTVKFNAVGNPVIGNWRSQGLVLRGKIIDGMVVRQTDDKYLLTAAELTGGVRTELSRVQRGITRSTVLTSDRAKFEGNSTIAKLDLTGSLTVTSSLSNGSQWMQLTGSGGDFSVDMSKQKEQPLQSATVNGPVTLRLINKGNGTDITVTGRRLTFRAQGQEIELIGGVVVSGTGPAIIGRMQVNSVRITLDAQGLVQEVFAEGDPGNATVREKP